jgi:hypothetical protein
MALASDDGHDTGFADAAMNLVNTALFQGLPDPPGCVHLFQTQLRMGMQISAQCGDFGCKGCNLRKGATVNLETRVGR